MTVMVMVSGGGDDNFSVSFFLFTAFMIAFCSGFMGLGMKWNEMLWDENQDPFSSFYDRERLSLSHWIGWLVGLSNTSVRK
jgi:hypothetical protein